MVELKSIQDVVTLIEKDDWMMNILRTVSSLELPDWWVCAGFVRSKIWDTLHEFPERTSLEDVDVIFFDQTSKDELEEKKIERELLRKDPRVPWSVKNQARMHHINDVSPYLSAEDGISKFPETPTALGVKLDGHGHLLITAPCGIEDVLKLEVKPTPFFRKRKELAPIYNKRIQQKDWQRTWPKVQLYSFDGLEIVAKER